MSDESAPNEGGGKRGKQTRERILQVAEALIAQHGVDGFELKEVAAQVGIRSPSIFAHFKGREDLAEAVARRVGLQVVEQFGKGVSSDPTETLRNAVSAMVAHLAGNPAHVRILLADLARHREVGKLSGSAEQVLTAEAQVEVLLKLGVESGVFRPVRTDLFIAHVLGSILSALAWYGWDAEGNLQGPIELAEVQAESQLLALNYLAPATAS